MAREVQEIPITSMLWKPSDDLYLRSLVSSNEVQGPIWRQLFIGNGTSSLCGQQKLPLLCMAVLSAVESAPPGLLFSAKVSFLSCSKCEIVPHCGPTTERLRIMIPLVLEKDAYFDLLVGYKRPLHNITLGEPIIFDDSIEHTVRYESSSQEPRIVLLLDIKKPIE